MDEADNLFHINDDCVLSYNPQSLPPSSVIQDNENDRDICLVRQGLQVSFYLKVINCF